MSEYIAEALLRNFELYFPSDVENMISYEVGDLSLIATLKDGTKVVYDDLTNSRRVLPSDPNEMTDEEMLSEFQYRLRRAMMIRGVNQLELSERTGIPCSMISRYLTGENIPSFLKVEKIARALNCSLDELRYI